MGTMVASGTQVLHRADRLHHDGRWLHSDWRFSGVRLDGFVSKRDDGLRSDVACVSCSPDGGWVRSRFTGSDCGHVIGDLVRPRIQPGGTRIFNSGTGIFDVFRLDFCRLYLTRQLGTRYGGSEYGSDSKIDRSFKLLWLFAFIAV